MAGFDIASIVAILATGGMLVGLMRFLGGRKSSDDVFDFERDYAQALRAC